jgi:hypothetical protein
MNLKIIAVGATLLALIVSACGGGSPRADLYDCGKIIDQGLRAQCFSDALPHPSLADCTLYFVGGSELQKNCVERAGYDACDNIAVKAGARITNFRELEAATLWHSYVPCEFCTESTSASVISKCIKPTS